MIYVLDTDILSLLAHHRSQEAAHIRRRIVDLPDDAVATTIVNYEEQIRGWMAYLSRAKTPQTEIVAYSRLMDNLRVFRKLKVLPYDETAVRGVDELSSRAIRIGRMDLKIAAITLAIDATLITRNILDFQRVP